MPVKEHKPVTPGRRGYVSLDRSGLDNKPPEKALTIKRKQKAGRNANGRITSRHRGGGHKRRIRLVDFKRDKDDIEAKVAAIEYDPGRSAHLALLHYVDGEKRYILAPEGLEKGTLVISGEAVPIRPG
ncbi:MAG: 50S ribosomal protein L2, partial [Armatimonadetes bacterium]|nr:50S ribosomal protein L2 [Armatimonadota bacterium]